MTPASAQMSYNSACDVKHQGLSSLAQAARHVTEQVETAEHQKVHTGGGVRC